MNVLDEDTKSLWMETFIPAAARFSGQARADVGVVGAGIAGLSVAYALAARGRSVIVLDRGRIGCGMTARTTAHLATALDHDYKELIRVRGEDFARLYYQSVAAAIDHAQAIPSAEGIDCDFRRLDGYWVLAPETLPSHWTRNSKAAESSESPSNFAAIGPQSITAVLRARFVFRGRLAFIRPNILPDWPKRCIGEFDVIYPAMGSKVRPSIRLRWARIIRRKADCH